jgi:hypothetical protein
MQTLIGVEEAVQLSQDEEVASHPTYVGLADSIWTTLKAIDPLAGYQNMQFSAQDDSWEIEYRRRSGLPLVAFRNRWESLRLLPRGTTSEAVQFGSLQRDPEGTLKEILTCDLARTYLSSLPGWDEKSPNVAFHAQLRDFLEWKREERALGKDLIDILYDQLTYRLDSMREADRLREQMGLIFADISTFNTDVWILNCNHRERSRHAPSTIEFSI